MVWECRQYSTVPSCVCAAEQRVWRLNSERTREYHEEQRDEFESYAEEERDGKLCLQPLSTEVTIEL